MAAVQITLRILPVPDYSPDLLAVDVADRIRDVLVTHPGVDGVSIVLTVDGDEPAG